ncbi:MAG TPA: hypothetical protein VFA68_08315 [Terriglobales bacterium]|nr:hypothetical protein [Terriglobales bacterium]
MKKELLRSILVLSLLLVAGSAFAQTISISSNVPFAFNVAGKSLPAGEYSIKSMTSDGRTLALKGSEPAARMIVNSNGAQKIAPADATKLVFHVYGSEYFLSQIWVAGNDLGYQVPVSKRERELAKSDASQNLEVLAQLQ